MLFLVLLFAPQAPLRVGQVKGIVSAPVPTLRHCVTVGVVLIVAVAVGSRVLPTTSVMLAGLGLIYAIVMLSLVLLTGYGGHVSLAQLTFLGIGAVTAAKLATPSPWALIVAALTAAGVGALVSLPVLRLTGLYLALSTLAFGQLMDKLVFQAPFVFGFNGSLNAQRVTILGLRVGTERGYLVLIAVVFVLMAIALLALRRGRVGRLLIAMRDADYVLPAPLLPALLDIASHTAAHRAALLESYVEEVSAPSSARKPAHAEECNSRTIVAFSSDEPADTPPRLEVSPPR